MLWNLGTEGMAAADGPWLSRRSVPLRSMFDTSRPPALAAPRKEFADG
jgi:hypothetical protein